MIVRKSVMTVRRSVITVNRSVMTLSKSVITADKLVMTVPGSVLKLMLRTSFLRPTSDSLSLEFVTCYVATKG